MINFGEHVSILFFKLYMKLPFEEYLETKSGPTPCVIILLIINFTISQATILSTQTEMTKAVSLNEKICVMSSAKANPVMECHDDTKCSFQSLIFQCQSFAKLTHEHNHF